jgi:hypothetical protein
MSAPQRFPWKLATTGGGLLLLALLTVSIRTGAVAEGRALMRLEHRRAALERRARDLQLDLQRRWQELGQEERGGQDDAARARGGSRS